MHIHTHPHRLPHYLRYLQVKRAIRAFLESEGYLELDVPVLSPALIPESCLEVFETEFTYLDHREKLYLTPSPELFIKRLLAGGISDCYYLGKSFRNSEPTSPKHAPEFTMLEVYKVGKQYRFMADTVLRMLAHLARTLYEKEKIIYNGASVSFDRWEEMTTAEAFETYAQIHPSEFLDKKAFLKRAKEKGYRIDGFGYEEVWSQIYAAEIEPHLGTNGYPTILYDYPICFAPLSQPNPDGKTAQRFEFYIGGVELGNCYTELIDASLQDERLREELSIRRAFGKIEHPYDAGFIEAVRAGMPPSTGIAIGVERLAMVLLGLENISDCALVSIT